MKKFEMPEIQVIAFESESVMTLSITGTENALQNNNFTLGSDQTPGKFL